MNVSELFFAYWDWYLLIGIFIGIWFILHTSGLPGNRLYDWKVKSLAFVIVTLMWPAMIVYRYLP